MEKTIATICTGGGILEQGAIAAGLKPIWGVEINPRVADVYRLNYPDSDIKVQDVIKVLWQLLPHPDFLHASPSCRNYSCLNTKSETSKDLDVAKAISRAIAFHKPEIFTLENVSKYQDSNAWRIIEEKLKELRYHVSIQIINFKDWGIPQKRRIRFIVVACRDRPAPLLLAPNITQSWYELIKDQIPLLKPSELTNSQQKKLTEKTQRAIAARETVLLKRNQIRDTTGCAYASEPLSWTVTATLCTDDDGSNRSLFADLVTKDGTFSLNTRSLARIQTIPDSYQIPDSIAVSGLVIGDGVPSFFAQQMYEQILASLGEGVQTYQMTHNLDSLATKRQGIELWVGSHTYSVGGEIVDLAGARCFSAAVKNLSYLKAINPDALSVMLDSGAFSDRHRSRLSASEALNRQLQWEEKASSIFGREFIVDYLVAYDCIVDQQDNDEVIQAAIETTVANARYLADRRQELSPRKLVLVAQGATTNQYVNCLNQILEFADVSDIIGFGGWCSLGKNKSRLDDFQRTLETCFPLVESRKVHIFGCTYLKALIIAYEIACKYQIILSVDSTRPIMDHTRKDKVKAGAKGNNWRESVEIWKYELNNIGNQKESTNVEKKSLPLSFAKTVDPLLSGNKTCTRRDWKNRTAKTYCRYYEEGKLIKAFDKSPRFKGKAIALIQLTEAPYQEKLADMPSEDLLKEGGMCQTVDDFIDKYFDGNQDLVVWVVRFKLVKLLSTNVEEKLLPFYDDLPVSMARRSPSREFSTSTQLQSKAISLWQPWASLIGLEIKKYETRSWKTDYRGKLVICSAKKTTKQQQQDYSILAQKYQLDCSWDDLPFGQAIAVCDLVDCLCITESLIQTMPRQELDCGYWKIGRYAWKLDNIKVLSNPIPVKGKQRLWDIELGNEASSQKLLGNKCSYKTESSTKSEQKALLPKSSSEELKLCPCPDTDVSLIKRPAARWIGGKWLLGKWIVSHFPKHKIYCEPFGGMFSVGLRSPVSKQEIYNDLHSEAVNFWTQLKYSPNELIPLIEQTQVTSNTLAWVQEEGIDKIDRAHKFYFSCLLKFDGGGGNFFSSSEARLEGAKDHKHDHLWQISNRIQNLVIKHSDAIKIIKEYDSSETLFYIDPCYLPETRRKKNNYLHDLDQDYHVELAKVLKQIKGKVILSGYSSQLYKELYPDWISKNKPSRTTGHSYKDEVIWFNFEPTIDPKENQVLHDKYHQLVLSGVQGISNFQELGDALINIRDRQLYKVAGYKSFIKYCWEKFELSQPRIYQLINALKVVESLNLNYTNVDKIPRLNESHCRELAKIENLDRRSLVLANVIKKGDLTAKRIKAENRRVKLQELDLRQKLDLPEKGSVVRIIDKYDELVKQYYGQLALVTYVNDFSVNLYTLGGEIKVVHPQNFVLISDGDGKLLEWIIYRMEAIILHPGCNDTAKSICNTIISRAYPILDDMDNFLLTAIEQRYKIN